MKKGKLLWLLLFACMLTACQKAAPQADSGLYELYEGYVTVEGDTLVVDDFTFIDLADTYWIHKLGLTAEDMPDNYYIDDPTDERLYFTLDEQTRYNFYDTGNLFVTEDADKKYTTTKREEFLQFLKPKDPTTPVRIPFEIQVLDGRVLTITEILVV